MEREIKRQLVHGGIGFIFVIGLYWGFISSLGKIYPFNLLEFMPSLSRPLFVLLVSGGVLVILCKYYRVPGLDWILKELERPEDRETFPGRGSFFFAFGAFFMSLFFKPSTVLASMMILSLGDSSSHIIGKKLGQVDHPLSDSKKKIEGHVFGAILGGLGASLFIYPVIAFIASFVSMFIEGISFGGHWFFDDNLIVPISAGILISILT